LRIDTTTRAGTFVVEARFDAHPGVTALFGPSGSGKSLTVLTIAGLLRPQRGSIELHGRTIADAAAGLHVPSQLRRVGMVAQPAALLPYRSPLDNVALAIRGSSRATRRAAAHGLLEEVGAGQLATSPTPTLSGGEQQRVALARALAGQPELLLLDEPFAALDLATRARLRALVRTIVDERHLPAVLVTHDLDDVSALADRIVRYQPGATIDQHDLAPDPHHTLGVLLGFDH
jgi:molybdate transport system ATP-binding protein